MNYEEFRTAVCDLLGGLEKEWDVVHDWGVPPVDTITGNAANFDAEMEMEYDFIQLERDKGVFYSFISFPVKALFNYYQKEGWNAAVRELQKHIPKETKENNKPVDYPAKLNEEGKKLYERLRSLRSEIAMKKQVPAYIIFTNRTLYEMCRIQPATMEELLFVYGVGEKNSKEYGQEFLDAIKDFTKGGKLILEKAELEVDSVNAEPDIHSADEFEADDLGGVVARTWRRGVMDPDLIKG